jgi:hypothetical protein
MPRNAGPITPGTTIDINVGALMKNTVVAYAMWWRPAGSANWQLVGEGDTGDERPDHYTIPGQAPAQLYYWIGIGSKSPNAVYSALIALSQGGWVIAGGNVQENGTTDASKVDVKEDWVEIS